MEIQSFTELYGAMLGLQLYRVTQTYIVICYIVNLGSIGLYETALFSTVVSVSVYRVYKAVDRLVSDLGDHNEDALVYGDI